MPMAVYCLMFKDPQLKKAYPIQYGDWDLHITEIVKIIGTCHFYLVHPREQTLAQKSCFLLLKRMVVYLLSCRTTMELGLIKPRVHLDYLPPKARLLTSTCDQPSKTRPYKPVIHYTKETSNVSAVPQHESTLAIHHQNITWPTNDDQLVTRQEHIMAQFPDVFPRCRQIPRWTIQNLQLDPQVSPKQTPCRPVPVHLKQAFKAEIDKMLRSWCSKTSQGGYSMDQ